MAEVTEKAGRDDNGNFGKGNSFAKGHGRKAKNVEKAYLRASMTAVSPAQWSAIVARAADDALKSDDDRVRNDARLFLQKVIFGNGAAGAIDQAKGFESKESMIDFELNPVPEQYWLSFGDEAVEAAEADG